MWWNTSIMIFLLICLSLVKYVASENGQWGQWSAWYSCTRTCGYDGYMLRQRYCNNPAPSNNGLKCAGDTDGDNLEEEKNKSCSQNPCPVDGNWGQWFGWFGCTKTCGWGGTRNRHRYCDNPAPSNGGQNCPGINHGTKLQNEIDTTCADKHCPVDGNWGQWFGWFGCTKTCGWGGTRNRYRYCDNPAPSNGGQNCPGINHGTKLQNEIDTTCADKHCPVSGAWSDWTSTGICSTTCGGGTMTHIRQCNPPPSHGGLSCNGNDTDYKSCGEKICPVDGFWGSWLSWNNCQSTCGNGTKSRKRQCDRPPPNNGGKNCLGNDTDEAVCLDQYCSDSLTSDGNSLGVIIGGIVTAVVVVLVVVKVFLLPKINSFTAGLRKRSSTNVHIGQTGINVSTTVDNNQDDAYLKLERVTGMRSVGNDYDELQVHNEVTGDPDNAYCDIALDDSSEYDKR